VVWSSLWPDHRDGLIRFDIDRGDGSGCSLSWTLPSPDAAAADAAVT